MPVPVSSRRKKDESGIRKCLVRKRIKELSKVRNEIPASGDMSVDSIRDASEDEDDKTSEVNPVEADGEPGNHEIAGPGIQGSRNIGQRKNQNHQNAHT